MVYLLISGRNQKVALLPSSFIYYIIKSNHPVEQGELINLTRLPRMTIQNAVDELKHQGLIMKKNSLEDTRKKAIILFNLIGFNH